MSWLCMGMFLILAAVAAGIAIKAINTIQR